MIKYHSFKSINFHSYDLVKLKDVCTEKIYSEPQDCEVTKLAIFTRQF